MKIGLDLDDTICDFITPLTNYANKKVGLNIKFDDYLSYDFADVWNMDPVTAQSIVTEFIFENDGNNILNLPPIPGAIEKLKKIKSKINCEYYIISARDTRLLEITKEWINKYFPINFINGIEFGNIYSSDDKPKRSKYEMCKNRNVQFLFEDRIDHIRDCYIKFEGHFVSMCLNRPWNSYKQSGLNCIMFTQYQDIKVSDIVYQFTKLTKSQINSFRNINIFKPIVIGISGKIGSGKDTCADILVETLSIFEKRFFAKRVKETVSALTETSIEYNMTQEGKTIIPEGFEESLGRLQQLVGEGLREKIREDVWVKCILNKKIGKFTVISDCRYKTEARGILNDTNINGILIRLEGDPKDVRKLNLAKRDLFHSSEVDLDEWPFEYVIYNEGISLEDLKIKFLSIVYNFICGKIF